MWPIHPVHSRVTLRIGLRIQNLNQSPAATTFNKMHDTKLALAPIVRRYEQPYKTMLTTGQVPNAVCKGFDIPRSSPSDTYGGKLQIVYYCPSLAESPTP